MSGCRIYAISPTKRGLDQFVDRMTKDLIAMGHEAPASPEVERRPEGYACLVAEIILK